MKHFQVKFEGNSMKYPIVFLAVSAIGLLSIGCKSMPINPVSTQNPISIELADESTTIELRKVSTIDAGTVLGYYDWNYYNRPINYVPSNETLFKDSLIKAFYREAAAAGYKTTGSPDDLFDDTKDKSPTFVIAAKISDIRQNRYTAAFGIRVKQYLKVEWQVYSGQSQEIVATFVTEGYCEDKIPLRETPISIINEAIANAVKNLLALQGFVDAVTTVKGS